MPKSAVAPRCQAAVPRCAHSVVRRTDDSTSSTLAGSLTQMSSIIATSTPREGFLKADDVFGCEAMRAPVEVRLEGHAVVIEFAPRLEAEDLEPAAVGEDRAVPGHEPVQAAERDQRFTSGPQPEMIGVRKDDVRVDLAQVGRRNALDGGGGADRHEGRRLDGAVGELQRAAPGGAAYRMNGERAHLANASSVARYAGGGGASKVRCSFVTGCLKARRRCRPCEVPAPAAASAHRVCRRSDR